MAFMHDDLMEEVCQKHEGTFKGWREKIENLHRALAKCQTMFGSVTLPGERIVVGFESYGTEYPTDCQTDLDVLLTVSWDAEIEDHDPDQCLEPQHMTPAELIALSRVQERFNAWKLGDGEFPTQRDAYGNDWCDGSGDGAGLPGDACENCDGVPAGVRCKNLDKARSDGP